MSEETAEITNRMAEAAHAARIRGISYDEFIGIARQAWIYDIQDELDEMQKKRLPG